MGQLPGSPAAVLGPPFLTGNGENPQFSMVNSQIQQKHSGRVLLSLDKSATEVAGRRSCVISRYCKSHTQRRMCCSCQMLTGRSATPEVNLISRVFEALQRFLNTINLAIANPDIQS